MLTGGEGQVMALVCLDKAELDKAELERAEEFAIDAKEIIVVCESTTTTGLLVEGTLQIPHFAPLSLLC